MGLPGSEPLPRRKISRWWDLSATGLSTACMLHCLGLPFLAVILPISSQLADQHLLHQIMLGLALPITAWVVWHASSEAGSGPFITIAVSGLGLMLLAVAVEALHDYETHLTVLGGSLLGGAHLWRWFNHDRPTPSSESSA